MSEERFTFFFHKESPFSQFHNVKFIASPLFPQDPPVDPTADIFKIEFQNCEKWMMFHKAILFGDKHVAEKILQTTDPQTCKSLGRKVKNFDQKVWDKNNERIIYEGNHHKFTQNQDLLKKLLETEGTTLVEASPYDKIYGIGLASNDPRALKRSTWQGQNLLGQILTRLRTNLSMDTSK